MAAFPCAVEPLLDTPSSLPAVQLQLRMVESSIASAEHDLEASWLNTCFPQPAPGFYVDEELGFAGAPQLRRCSEALGDFREARQKLLLRLEELQPPKQQAEEAKAAEDRLKERVRRLEFKLADAESWNDKMSEAMQKLLQTQAGLEQSVESLETQCAALRHQTSAAESCKDQLERWLGSQRMAQESTIEQLRAENVKLQRENAALAEQAQLQQRRADRLHEENDQLRGQGGYPEIASNALAADCDACSDVSSWVCVPCSDRNVFAAGTMLKAKVGQAFEYLQAKDLQKGAQILASDDQSLLEVLDSPETQRSVELIELSTEDRMLCVARQQLLLSAPAVGDALQEEAASSTAQACLAETLHPGDWIKVNGRFSRLTRVEVRALAEEAELVQFDLSPSLPAATFSLALREKDPFVAAV